VSFLVARDRKRKDKLRARDVRVMHHHAGTRQWRMTRQDATRPPRPFVAVAARPA
jgi:hypothetical protein